MQEIVNKIKEFIIENELIKSGDFVIALNSFGKDSASMIHILNKIKEELHFELKNLNIQYPQHVFFDEEVARIINFWESIGLPTNSIKIPENVHDITNLNIKDCLYCKKIRRDFIKNEIEQHLENHDRVVVATAHNYWDLVGYIHSIAIQTDFFSSQPKNQIYITEMLGRFSPKNDFGKIQIIRPILILSDIDVYRYLFENEVQRLSSICKNRDLRPKRVIANNLLNNEEILNISYKGCVNFINKVNFNMRDIEKTPWEVFLC